jgi:hypothetical protein
MGSDDLDTQMRIAAYEHVHRLHSAFDLLEKLTKRQLSKAPHRENQKLLRNQCRS